MTPLLVALLSQALPILLRELGEALDGVDDEEQVERLLTRLQRVEDRALRHADREHARGLAHGVREELRRVRREQRGPDGIEA